MATLRSELIKLAKANPDLRSDILPLLTGKSAGIWDNFVKQTKSDVKNVKDFAKGVGNKVKDWASGGGEDEARNTPASDGAGKRRQREALKIDKHTRAVLEHLKEVADDTMDQEHYEKLSWNVMQGLADYGATQKVRNFDVALAKVADLSKNWYEACENLSDSISTILHQSTSKTSSILPDLVKIAAANPELRADLMPIIAAAKKTFTAVRSSLLDRLKEEKWNVRVGIATPWAESPDGTFRLWFKPQAVYYSHGDGVKNIGTAHSMHIDIRDTTPDVFMAIIKDVMKSP